MSNSSPGHQVHALECAGQQATKISLKISAHDVQITTVTRHCAGQFASQIANKFSFH